MSAGLIPLSVRSVCRASKKSVMSAGLGPTGGEGCLCCCACSAANNDCSGVVGAADPARFREKVLRRDAKLFRGDTGCDEGGVVGRVGVWG